MERKKDPRAKEFKDRGLAYAIKKGEINPGVVPSDTKSRILKYMDFPIGELEDAAKSKFQHPDRFMVKRKGRKRISKFNERVYNNFMDFSGEEPEWDDQLHGGRADGLSPDDFDQVQLNKGRKIQREHSVDPRISTKIAMDHIKEYEPLSYYDKLKEMEDELRQELNRLKSGGKPEENIDTEDEMEDFEDDEDVSDEVSNDDDRLEEPEDDDNVLHMTIESYEQFSNRIK